MIILSKDYVIIEYRTDNFEQGGFSEHGHSKLGLLKDNKYNKSTNDLLTMTLDLKKLQNLSKSNKLLKNCGERINSYQLNISENQ
jgi:hypothetical protein